LGAAARAASGPLRPGAMLDTLAGARFLPFLLVVLVVMSARTE
jgi:hypothetical protein